MVKTIWVSGFQIFPRKPIHWHVLARRSFKDKNPMGNSALLPRLRGSLLRNPKMCVTAKINLWHGQLKQQNGSITGMWANYNNSLTWIKAIWAVFFLGAWVLYTNLGYLRSVYAGLRRVEGRLRRSTWQQIAYARAYASLFDCCAKVRRMSNSTYAILPTPENQQLPTRGAYAAYATLQNTQHQPTQHIMQFPFQLKGIVSKKKRCSFGDDFPY